MNRGLKDVAGYVLNGGRMNNPFTHLVPICNSSTLRLWFMFPNGTRKQEKWFPGSRPLECKDAN
jgi:hypothetical protein